MNITDLMGQEVIHLNRPLRCQLCCFPCCLQVSSFTKQNKTKQKLLKEMEVSSPPGTVIGTISQQWSIFNQESVYFGHYPESTTGDILQIADKG